LKNAVKAMSSARTARIEIKVRLDFFFILRRIFRCRFWTGDPGSGAFGPDDGIFDPDAGVFDMHWFAGVSGTETGEIDFVKFEPAACGFFPGFFCHIRCFPNFISSELRRPGTHGKRM
jgi:hypothetical protein